MAFIRQTIKRHIDNNTLKYIFCIAVFTAGIFFGVLFSLNQSGESTDILMSELGTTLQNVRTSDFDIPIIIKTSASKALRNTLIIFTGGLCIYFLPFVFMILALCGFSCGFTLFCLGSGFGSGGFLVGISSVVIDFFVCIPVYFVMSVNAMNYALQKRKKRYEQTFAGYFICTFLCFLALFPSVITDSFVVPEIVKGICMYFAF